MAAIIAPTEQFNYVSRAPASAVSWGAVVAGAAGAAALSLILLVLGTGLGLSAVSPWVSEGISAEAFGWSTIAWISFMSVASSALGGYIAGRLRARWTDSDNDEIYFRDTAHGFLAWAVASLATAALLTGAVGAIVNGGAKAGAAGAAAAAASPMAYHVDTLFRGAQPSTIPSQPLAATPAASPQAPVAPNPAQDAEIARIFTKAGSADALPAEDMRYVGQLVSQRTGLAQPEAERRVTETYAAARQAADKAREASAYAALWLFISLLAGAFVASLSATWGGRRRDARTVDIPLNP